MKEIKRLISHNCNKSKIIRIILFLSTINLLCYFGCSNKDIIIQMKGKFTSKYDSQYIKTGIHYKENFIYFNVEYHTKKGIENERYAFIRMRDDIYQIQEIGYFDDNKVDTVLFLTFTKHDTCFIRNIRSNEVTNTLVPWLCDWKLSIRQIDKNYFNCTMINLHDSTYKEIFYFDNNYIVKKVNIRYGDKRIELIQE